MKTKKLLWAFMAIAVFTACNNDDKNGRGIDIDEEGTTSLSINLSVDGSTRAVTFPGNESTSAEERIYNAIAVAFDKRGLLEATAEFDAFSIGGKTPSEVSLLFENISTGAHQFYVLANAPRTLLERKSELFERGMNVATFREEIAYLSSVGNIIREDVNAPANTSDVNRGFLMSSEEPISRTLDADPEQNTIAVKLIRAVAKVSVAYDPVEELEGTLNNVTYRVIQNPRQMYIFPNWSADKSFFYTPLFEEGFNPSNYMTSAHNYIPAITPGGEPTHTYCIENSRMAPELQGNSTRVLIKGKFIPDPAYLKGNATSNTDDTFYRLRDENTGIWEAGYYYDYNEALDDQVAGQEIVEFEEGICYYNTWIKSSATGSYAVKRNTYVKLTVTNLHGVGEPGEGGGVNPIDPIDETTNATITVEVLDWDGDDQNITL